MSLLLNRGRRDRLHACAELALILLASFVANEPSRPVLACAAAVCALWLCVDRARCDTGRLQMHCQTHELKAWLERPSYGAPQLAGDLPVVQSKCAILETPAGAATAARAQLAAPADAVKLEVVRPPQPSCELAAFCCCASCAFRSYHASRKAQCWTKRPVAATLRPCDVYAAHKSADRPRACRSRSG